MKTPALVAILFLLVLDFSALGQRRPVVCTTDLTAPPVSGPHWASDTDITVYFARNMFTPKQREALLAAMDAWNIAEIITRSGVEFSYGGEIDQITKCRDCLTVSRRQVRRIARDHLALFFPIVDRDGFLGSARIDLDVGTTNLRALSGFMAHEIGHGMGLWDCATCKKKGTVMNAFPGVNSDNGLAGPSACDMEAVRELYQRERFDHAITTFITNRY